MVPLIIFAAIAVVPLLAALILRVSPVMLFLAVAVGALLERSAGDSAELAINMLIRNEAAVYIGHIGLLVLPVILTLFFLRKSAHASIILGFLPLVATCVALAVLVVPLMPPDLQKQLYADQYGKLARQSSDLTVAVAALLNLLLAWRTHGHGGHGKHH